MVKSGQAKKRLHSGHHTQWAAQFAVASELCKRGYDVSLTMGNHPIIDLMVISPKKHINFIIDVKGLHKPNPWLVRKKKKTHDNLFYVFAYVPKDEQNLFFILTESQVNMGIREDWKQAIANRKARGFGGEPVYLQAIKWKFAERYKDAWKSLPQ